MTADIVVTGATGFVGRRVLGPLVERGFRVTALGRHRPGNDGVDFRHVDLLNPGEGLACLRELRATHLLHLAWCAVPGLFWTSPENIAWSNASLRLLDAFAAAGGRRALLVGTCAEYDWTTSVLSEAGSPCLPSTLYGAAKYGTYLMADRLAAQAGVSLAWARLFYMYGPGETGGRLVSDACNALLAGRRFAASSGVQRRDYIHVDDVAGSLAAIVSSAVTGPVNVGLGDAPSVRAILEEVARAAGNRLDLLEFGAQALRPNDPPVIEADVKRLRDEVGFRPRFTLAEGMANTVQWWRERMGTMHDSTAGRPT